MAQAITFPFDERKAAQAAAHLLERHGGTLNYMKLIKLLYLADREAFLSRGAPITGDKLFSLPHGPVLSRTLNLIKGEGAPPAEGSECSKYVAPRSVYNVTWTENTDRGALSAIEIQILEAIDKRYGGMTEWELRKYTHERLPEYEDPGTSRIPISFEAIHKASKRTDRITLAQARERSQEALSARSIGNDDTR